MRQTSLSKLQCDSLDNLISNHGIDKSINFFLDLMIENKIDSNNHTYWINSLKYISNVIYIDS